MRKVRLGKTNLIVSEVGFGGIPIQRLTDEEAVRVVRGALALGIDFIDTAHGYPNSEERIGRAIAGRQEGLVLATKSPARDGPTFRQHMDLSFERLAVDHIDLFQFHNVSSPEAYEAVLAPSGPLHVARAAQAAGRIGHIGISSHSLAMSLEVARSGHFETLMFPLNFVTDEAVQQLVPLCLQHDVGFIAMKPMGGGLLESASLAFKYLGRYPGVLPLVGIERVSEVEEIISIVDGPADLTVSELAEMNRIRRELGSRFCRRCGYCQPCPQDINISLMLNLPGFARRFAPDRIYGDWGQQIIATAETCLDCGECESRCPYNLPIRQIMQEMIAWYRQQQGQRA